MAGLATAAMITGGATILGGGMNMIGSSKNAKAAGRAMDSQERMAQADLAFRQQQYNRYLGLFGPVEEQLAGEAQSTQPLDYDKNAAAIKQNYGQALRNISSSMGMRGMAGSGLDMGAMRGAAYQQAGDLSNAFATGLINRRNLGLTLTGRGQIGQAAQGVGQGMQGLANLYGQQAGMYNQAAAQGWNNFGNSIAGLGQMYGQYLQNQQIAPYSITGRPGSGSNFGNNWGQPVQTVPIDNTPPGGYTSSGIPIS